MATSIEAQGLTVDEAIQIALNQLGVSRDKVEVEILHHPRRGLLGIGARRAKVRATIRESVMLDGEEFDMSGGAALDDKPRRRRRRGGRNRGGREGERPGGAPTAPRPAAAPAREAGRGEGERRGEQRGESRRDEGGRGRGDSGRSRDDRRGGRGREQRGGERHDARGDQQRGDARQEPRQDARQESRQEPRNDARRGDAREGGRPERSQEGGRHQGRESGRGGSARQADDGIRQQGRDAEGRGARESRGGRERQQERRDRGARGDESETASFEQGELSPATRPSPQSRRAPAPEEPPLDAAALDAIRARAEDLVRELLQKMGFAAEVTSNIDEAAGEAVVSVRSENEGLLIGRRGQTLDSLEHIVNRMALRGDQYVEGRVLLDIGDYRRRRRESLEELANRLRTRAVTERRTVQVSPMSPRDRKFFAQSFGEDEAVEVRALGAGFYRRVIVAPAGMGAAAAAESHADVEDESADATFAEAELEG